MKPDSPFILTINGGSSSIKFALFCYQVKKWIGAFAAALGGLDALVFAGGIGENAPAVRQTWQQVRNWPLTSVNQTGQK